MLIDRLNVTNLKLWHVENKVRDVTISGEELKKINVVRNDLNVQRNALIEEIDILMYELMTGKREPIVVKAHKMYQAPPKSQKE